MAYPKISKLDSPEKFLQHLESIGVALPFDSTVETGRDSLLGSPVHWQNRTIGNRFCILPMEGWDGTSDGKPSDLTRRRWRNFGISGAKLIWGGEAVAVRPDGRANPNQLVMTAENLVDLESLRQDLIDAHREHFDTTDDLVVGLQLTHSGRFARPNDKNVLEPKTVYSHPVLDPRFDIDSKQAILSDDEIKRLIDDFVIAAKFAGKMGFDFVDIKHCHGYFGHELLSGFDRPGEFGGDFVNRTRFLRDVAGGIRATAPVLKIGVRLSVFDFAPFHPDEKNTGRASAAAPYSFAFGGDRSGVGIDLAEPRRFLELLRDLQIDLLCSTAGSPYYNPHIQRPAIFPPSDGYLPPEDPVVGVARQINTTGVLKDHCDDVLIVGSGYSYLQEWIPSVGQAVIRNQMADFVGLGRMVLSYPEFPADVLNGRVLARKKICRTFSDCTTAPRNGLVSGCYPLDAFYKQHPDNELLAKAKNKN